MGVPAGVSLSGGQVRTIVVSCLAVALVVASMAALYTALPDLAVAAGASQNQLTWIVDGYTLTLAALVLPGGDLGDRYGRRMVLTVGLAVFSVASAVPLAVHDPVWLIASRAAAGVGAALVMPSTLSILTSGLPEDYRGRAVGIWAGVAGGGGIIGILASGVLLEFWSWESIFIALTAAGVVLLVGAATVPESRDATAARLDPVGMATVVLAVGLLVLSLLEAPVRGWGDPTIVTGFALAGLAALVFVVWELRSDQGLLDVRLFADRGFGGGSLSLTIQFLITFGMFLMLVQFLQLIFGYGPLWSALAMAPMAVPLVGVSIIAPWLTARVGLRAMTVTGLVAIAGGLYVMSRLTVDSHYIDVVWTTLLMSLGLGLAAAPATMAIMTGTPAEKHGVAAAVNDATREVGAAIGIAVSGSVLAAAYGHRIAPALGLLPEQARGPVGESLAGALQVADRVGPTGGGLADFAKGAFMSGVEQSSLVLMSIAIAGAAVLAVLMPGRSRPRPAPDHAGAGDRDDEAAVSAEP